MGHVMVYLFYCLENTILQYPAYPTFLFLPAPSSYILTSPIIASTTGNNLFCLKRKKNPHICQITINCVKRQLVDIRQSKFNHTSIIIQVEFYKLLSNFHKHDRDSD